MHWAEKNILPLVYTWNEKSGNQWNEMKWMKWNESLRTLCFFRLASSSLQKTIETKIRKSWDSQTVVFFQLSHCSEQSSVMGNVNPKSSSLPKVVVKYVNKGEEESLKSATADLNFVVDDFWWRIIFK